MDLSSAKIQMVPADQIFADSSTFVNIEGYTVQATLTSIDSLIGGQITDLSEVAVTSGSWNSTYTTVNSDSAIWASTVDLSEVAAASGSWNSAYTDVNANSATWNTVNELSSVPRLTGDNVFVGNNTFENSLTTGTVFLTDITTIGTSVTSTGMFVTLYVNGSAFGLQLFGI